MLWKVKRIDETIVSRGATALIKTCKTLEVELLMLPYLLSSMQSKWSPPGDRNGLMEADARDASSALSIRARLESTAPENIAA